MKSTILPTNTLIRHISLAIFASILLSSAVFAQTVFADWNASYSAPAGWQLIHKTGNVHAYSDGSNEAIIIVGVGLYESTAEIRTAIDQLVPGIFKTYGLRGNASGRPQTTRLHGKQAFIANYSASDKLFRPYKARSSSMLSGKGTAIGVFAMAANARYSKTISLADKILASAKMSAPQDNKRLMAAVAGSWTYYDGSSTSSIAGSGYTARSYQETVWFDGRGNYRWSSSAHASANGRVTNSGTSRGASGFSDNKLQGTYRIIGSSLIVKSRHGQQVYEIEVRGDAIISNGRYYIKGNG